jgi:hypothetical protein
MRRVRSALLLAIIVTVVFVLSAGRTLHDAERPITVQRPAVDFFAIGWYNGLDRAAALFDMAEEGANAVMPYWVSSANASEYLRTAHRAGMRVLLEVDREIVRDGETGDLVRFIDRFKDAPSLWGWYLADEPSTNTDVGPLSAERATELYRAIKRADPEHPVAIAFHTGEDTREYATAMDILMLDDYPFRPQTPQFASLPGWWKRLTDRAEIGRAVGGFVPILQAFGGRGSPPHFVRRFPSTAETRYMVYASLEAGATGIFLWTRYRSQARWIEVTMMPLADELRALDAALRSGTVETATRVDRRDVGLTMFPDPRTGERVLIVIHHGSDDVTARLTLDPQLRGARVEDVDGSPVEASRDEIVTTLGPFDVKVFRLRPRAG